jgi:hypothetical protein
VDALLNIRSAASSSTCNKIWKKRIPRNLLIAPYAQNHLPS